EWHVRCDIGPDWIGAGREIRFYLEQRPLAGNSFHQYLKDILVQALSIPDECPDAVINGYGTITRVLDVLEIEYEWSEAVPYMDPRESRFGKVEFLRI
ncbi:MAG: hypothetical protein KDA66_16875, partial [Planctomycetaceae bacterium]|nr:hypothetical protein [Planctomycetaceae bacterium]